MYRDVLKSAEKLVRRKSIDMCIGLCTGMCVDLRIDMCIDMCIDMRTGVYGNIFERDGLREMGPVNLRRA